MNKESKFNVLASRKNNKDHLLTIGIPTFNRPKSLLRAVRSLNVIKNKPNIFIIISDNSENQLDITEINKFFDNQMDFDFVYLQNTKNLGAAENFNRIYEVSPTQKTMMLFDDDELRDEINQVIDTDLINSSKTLYFYHDFRFENPKEVSKIRRLKTQTRNHLNAIGRKELTLTHKSLLYTVPSFIGAIYHTEDLKKKRLTDQNGPTGDYLQSMQMSQNRTIQRINLKLINYYHGNNDSSNIETYSQFPHKNYEYRMNYLQALEKEGTLTTKTNKLWKKNIQKLYIAELRNTSSRWNYLICRLFQIKITIKHYLNLI